MNNGQRAAVWATAIGLLGGMGCGGARVRTNSEDEEAAAKSDESGMPLGPAYPLLREFGAALGEYDEHLKRMNDNDYGYTDSAQDAETFLTQTAKVVLRPHQETLRAQAIWSLGAIPTVKKTDTAGWRSMLDEKYGESELRTLLISSSRSIDKDALLFYTCWDPVMLALNVKMRLNSVPDSQALLGAEIWLDNTGFWRMVKFNDDADAPVVGMQSEHAVYMLRMRYDADSGRYIPLEATWMVKEIPARSPDDTAQDMDDSAPDDAADAREAEESEAGSVGESQNPAQPLP